MITSVISRNGTSRENEFSRVEEYVFILRFGKWECVEPMIICFRKVIKVLLVEFGLTLCELVLLEVRPKASFSLFT